MSNKKLLALYGLKWNPFAPDVAVEVLYVTPHAGRAAFGAFFSSTLIDVAFDIGVATPVHAQSLVGRCAAEANPNCARETTAFQGNWRRSVLTGDYRKADLIGGCKQRRRLIKVWLLPVGLLERSLIIAEDALGARSPREQWWLPT